VADGTQSPRQCVCVCVSAWATYVYQVRKWKRAANMKSCRHSPSSAHSPSVLRFIIGFEYNGIVMKCAANDGLQTVGGSVASRVLRLPLDSGPRVLRLRYWNDDSPPVLHRLSTDSPRAWFLAENKPNSCSAFVCLSSVCACNLSW